MRELEDVHLEYLLIIQIMRLLIDELSVLDNLKDVRLDSSVHHIGVLADRELNGDSTVLTIDGIDQLWLRDIPIGLSE
jgi:hypothetical protein